MKMRPLVGSMSRLIIFIVVVLPQPEGPTSMTISPAAISRGGSSPAGAAFGWYRLVTPSSRMRAPPVESGTVSDTNSPRGGEFGEQVEHRVEDDGQDEDPDGARDDRVGGVRPAGAGDAREDTADEP